MAPTGGTEAGGTGAEMETDIGPEGDIARVAVSLIGDATERTIGVAAAVAAGVADALALELEPATRLSTIALEASRNVVAHAYPDAPPGPLELRIKSSDGDAESSPRSLVVSVHDLGEGISLTPTPGDPPGLGLSMICALSDAIAIRSRPSQGMSLDATLTLDAPPAPVAAASTARPGSSLLSFGDVKLLSAVLPRALAAHVRERRLTLERMAETMLLGDAIARAIGSTGGAEVPDVSITGPNEDPSLRVRVGPLEAGGADPLIHALREGWGGSRRTLGLAKEPDGEDHEFARVQLALASS